MPAQAGTTDIWRRSCAQDVGEEHGGLPRVLGDDGDGEAVLRKVEAVGWPTQVGWRGPGRRR